MKQGIRNRVVVNEWVGERGGVVTSIEGHQALERDRERLRGK